MWIIAGDTNQGHYQSDVWNSKDGRNWTLIDDEVPWTPRVLHQTLVFNDRIFVIGGQTLPQYAMADEKFYNDIWSSNDGVNWDLVVGNAEFTPRNMFGSVVFNNKLWVLGGALLKLQKILKENFLMIYGVQMMVLDGIW